MVIKGKVQMDKEQAKPIVIGKDTVYIHTNIKEITKNDLTFYEAIETQYDKDEYLEILSKQGIANEALLSQILIATNANAQEIKRQAEDELVLELLKNNQLK